MKKKKSFFVKILLSNFFLFFVLLLTAILGWRIYGEYGDGKIVNNEIEEFKLEIRELEDESQALNKSIEYFDSDIFIEKEAREKLGLKKQGERVIVVPNESGIYDKSQDRLTNNTDTKEFLPKLWLEYFFVDK